LIGGDEVPHHHHPPRGGIAVRIRPAARPHVVERSPVSFSHDLVEPDLAEDLGARAQGILEEVSGEDDEPVAGSPAAGEDIADALAHDGGRGGDERPWHRRPHQERHLRPAPGRQVRRRVEERQADEDAEVLDVPISLCHLVIRQRGAAPRAVRHHPGVLVHEPAIEQRLE
jgi:hypothetical protein